MYVAYVCINDVCMYVCLYVCVCMRDASMSVCRYVCSGFVHVIFVRVYACMHVWLYLPMYEIYLMCVCNVCVYVCMRCMYVRYVLIYVIDVCMCECV